MNTYIIPVSWSMAGEYFLQANSLEEAIDMAKEAPLPEGTYAESSFEILTECIRCYNVRDRNGKIILPRMRVLVSHAVEGLPCPFEATTYKIHLDLIEVVLDKNIDVPVPERSYLRVPANSIQIIHEP